MTPTLHVTYWTTAAYAQSSMRKTKLSSSLSCRRVGRQAVGCRVSLTSVCCRPWRSAER